MGLFKRKYSKKFRETIDAIIDEGDKKDKLEEDNNRLRSYAAGIEEGALKLFLVDGIESNPKKLGGRWCLKGTRFPLSRVLAEISDDNKLSEIADDCDLDLKLLKSIFEDLSGALDEKPNSVASDNSSSIDSTKTQEEMALTMLREGYENFCIDYEEKTGQARHDCPFTFEGYVEHLIKTNCGEGG